MNKMAKKLTLIGLLLLGLITTVAYGMTINGQLVKAMLENLSSDPTGYLGRVYYNTTSNTAKIYTGSSWVELGAGSSSSTVVNLIENGGAETASIPAEWTTFDDGAVSVPVNGTGGSPSNITAIARTTTAGELISQDASFKFVKAAANAQGEGWAYDFTLPTKSQLFSSLVGLSMNFYFSSSSADNVVVYLYDKDNATLITPQFLTCGSSSGLTASTSACHLELAWLSTTADDYRLIFMVTGTGTNAWNFFADDIYTGQYTSAVGATVGGWTSFTASGAWVSNTTYTGFYKRTTDGLQIQYRVATSSNPTATNLIVNLPPGFTIDTSKLAAGTSTANYSMGTGNVSDSGTATHEVFGRYSSTTAIQLVYKDAVGTMASIAATTPISFGNGDAVDFRVYDLPIAELAGAANSFGENKIEWACNSSTTDAADTTSFVQGFAPCSVTGDLTAARAKRIRWATTPQNGDVMQCWLDPNGTGQWVHALGGSATSGGSSISPFDVVDETGLGQLQTTATATDFDFIFRRYRTGTSGWSGVSAAKWICSKSRPGAPINFGLATTTRPGLFQAGQAPGTATNDDACSTCVGYYVSNVRSTATPNLTTATITSIDSGNATFNDGNETGITLTAGDWDIQGTVYFLGDATTTSSSLRIFIGTAKGNSATGEVSYANETWSQVAYTAPVNVALSTPVWRVSISSPTTYYLKARPIFATSTLTATGSLKARRVR